MKSAKSHNSANRRVTPSFAGRYRNTRVSTATFGIRSRHFDSASLIMQNKPKAGLDRNLVSGTTNIR